MDDCLISSKRMDWGTPKPLFDALDKAVGGFDLDPCAGKDNRLGTPNFYTSKMNGLRKRWNGKVFMNPPYGNRISKWIEKAFNEVSKGHAELVACLIPARTDTLWWHRFCMKSYDIVYLRGRVKFIADGEIVHPAPFPSAVVIFKQPDMPEGTESTNDGKTICPGCTVAHLDRDGARWCPQPCPTGIPKRTGKGANK